MNPIRWFFFLPLAATEAVLLIIALLFAITARLGNEVTQVTIKLSRLFPDTCWYSGGPYHRAPPPPLQSTFEELDRRVANRLKAAADALREP